MVDIIIADSQILTREGLKSVLLGILDIQVTGIAKTNIELEQMLSARGHSLLVIDPCYNHRFTMQDIKNIRARFKDLPVLALTNRQARGRIQEAIDAGIKNYVFKECSREELIHAIYTTVQGGQFFCKNTYEVLFGNRLLPEKDDTLASLSSRETELIHLISEGLTNKEIAEKLFLSIHTVKTHRKNMIKKLGFTFKNIAEISALMRPGQ